MSIFSPLSMSIEKFQSLIFKKFGVSVQSRLLLLIGNLFILISIFSAQRIIINAPGYIINSAHFDIHDLQKLYNILRLSPYSSPKIRKHLPTVKC